MSSTACIDYYMYVYSFIKSMIIKFYVDILFLALLHPPPSLIRCLTRACVYRQVPVWIPAQYYNVMDSGKAREFRI